MTERYTSSDADPTRKIHRKPSKRWNFQVLTDDGNTLISTSGPIDPVSGECLRVLQIHIARMTSEELDTLVELTTRLEKRARSERG